METGLKKRKGKDKGFLFQKAFMCGIGSWRWWSATKLNTAGDGGTMNLRASL